VCGDSQSETFFERTDGSGITKLKKGKNKRLCML